MSEPDTDLEVVYQPPRGGRGAAGALLAAAVFTLGVLWITARVLRGALGALAAVAVCLVLLAAGTMLRRQRLIRPRRVVADRRAGAVRIEHLRGVEVVRFGDLASVTPGTTVLGEGLTLDVVTLTRRDSTTVTFSVMDSAAAEGAARALRAVTGIDAPDTTGGAP